MIKIFLVWMIGIVLQEKFFKPLQNERGSWPIADWIQLIAALGPLIMELIKMIEALFKSSTGAEKKEVAMAYAKAELPVGVVGGTISDKTLSGLIDNGVNLLNRSGLFTHKGPGKIDPPFISLF